MKKVWAKIGDAVKKKDFGSVSSLQVPVTWPDAHFDTVNVANLDNPKKQNIGRQWKHQKKLQHT
eukprot:3543842-Ditylum_brightwellii.AAC.1